MVVGNRPETVSMVVKQTQKTSRWWAGRSCVCVGGVQGKQDQQNGKSKAENIECQRALHCFQFPLINDEDIWTDDCGIEPITLIPPWRGMGSWDWTRHQNWCICRFPGSPPKPEVLNWGGRGYLETSVHFWGNHKKLWKENKSKIQMN